MSIRGFIAALLTASAATAGAEVQVKDYLGRELRLEAAAERVVALAPHIVENLFAGGAGDTIVAAVDYSDYPAAARTLPRVGGFNAYSLEAIVAAEPDLVITWLSGNGPEIVEQLTALGIPVYADEPETLEDIAHSLRDFGILTGRIAESEEAASDFLTQLDTLRARYRDAAKRSVFYQVWHQPLQTVNGEHIISDVIELCGGQNIFADAASLAPTVGRESILERDPDLIIASGMDAQRPPWLDDWRRFPVLTAVEEERLFFVPPDTIQRHTPRILQGAERVCRVIEKARS